MIQKQSELVATEKIKDAKRKAIGVIVLRVLKLKNKPGP